MAEPATCMRFFLCADYATVTFFFFLYKWLYSQRYHACFLCAGKDLNPSDVDAINKRLSYLYDAILAAGQHHNQVCS